MNGGILEADGWKSTAFESHHPVFARANIALPSYRTLVTQERNQEILFFYFLHIF